MFAEFELAIHQVVEKGGALSGDRLTKNLRPICSSVITVMTRACW